MMDAQMSQLKNFNTMMSRFDSNHTDSMGKLGLLETHLKKQADAARVADTNAVARHEAGEAAADKRHELLANLLSGGFKANATSTGKILDAQQQQAKATNALAAQGDRALEEVKASKQEIIDRLATQLEAKDEAIRNMPSKKDWQLLLDELRRNRKDDRELTQGIVTTQKTQGEDIAKAREAAEQASANSGLHNQALGGLMDGKTHIENQKLKDERRVWREKLQALEDERRRLEYFANSKGGDNPSKARGPKASATAFPGNGSMTTIAATDAATDKDNDTVQKVESTKGLDVETLKREDELAVTENTDGTKKVPTDAVLKPETLPSDDVLGSKTEEDVNASKENGDPTQTGEDVENKAARVTDPTNAKPPLGTISTNEKPSKIKGYEEHRSRIRRSAQQTEAKKLAYSDEFAMRVTRGKSRASLPRGNKSK